MEEKIIGKMNIEIIQFEYEGTVSTSIKAESDNKIPDSEIIIALETISKDLRKQKENQYEQSKYSIIKKQKEIK